MCVGFYCLNIHVRTYYLPSPCELSNKLETFQIWIFTPFVFQPIQWTFHTSTSWSLSRSLFIEYGSIVNFIGYIISLVCVVRGDVRKTFYLRNTCGPDTSYIYERIL